MSKTRKKEKKENFNFYKKRLLKLRDSLIQRIENPKEISLKTQRDFVGDAADAASINYTNMQSIDLQKNSRTLLYEIDQALRRIERGTYGRCLQCQQRIQKKRLDVIPYAELCIECQTKQESTP